MTARWRTDENGFELREELKSQMDEVRVRLGVDSAKNVLFVCRIKAVEDMAYFAWKVSGVFNEFKEDL